MLMRAAPYDVEAELDRGLWESSRRRRSPRCGNAPSRCKVIAPAPRRTADRPRHRRSRTEPDGLWIGAKIANTPAGRRPASLLATAPSTSARSRSGRCADCIERPAPRPDGCTVRHTRAELLGVAPGAHGAYGDAGLRRCRSATTTRTGTARQRDREAARPGQQLRERLEPRRVSGCATSAPWPATATSGPTSMLAAPIAIGRSSAPDPAIRRLLRVDHRACRGGLAHVQHASS